MKTQWSSFKNRPHLKSKEPSPYCRPHLRFFLRCFPAAHHPIPASLRSCPDYHQGQRPYLGQLDVEFQSEESWRQTYYLQAYRRRCDTGHHHSSLKTDSFYRLNLQCLWLFHRFQLQGSSLRDCHLRRPDLRELIFDPW